MSLTRVLCIDGGGLRGMIPATLLTVLEKQLQIHTQNPDARIVDFFDFIAGTSTGGILTALYLLPDYKVPHRPRFSAKEACDFYYQHGGTIFKKNTPHLIKSLWGLIGPKYSPKAYESLLAYYFEDTLLSQLLKPCLITAYDVRSYQATFFNQLDPFKPHKEDFFVKDIVRATSAAPTYFPPALISSSNNTPYTLVDGGTFANNPTLCAIVEASKLPHHPKIEELLILSLGTGTCHSVYRANTLNFGGAIHWAIPLLNIFTGGIAETVDCQTTTLYETHSLSEHYLRIQPNLLDLGYPCLPIDAASPDNLSLIKEMGLKVAAKYFDTLDTFAKRLVAQTNPSKPEMLKNASITL